MPGGGILLYGGRFKLISLPRFLPVSRNFLTVKDKLPGKLVCTLSGPVEPEYTFPQII
jgi:hypothetical protein